MAVATTLPGPHAIRETAPQPAEDERLTPARLARENARHDRILTGLLVLVTFLLASFPVTNSDVWMHLRTGQMIVEGGYTFGVDPYCYTTEGQYWTNTSWLTDVLFYATYRLAGGPGLVVLRGLILLAVLGLLSAMRRPGSSLFVSICGLGLAMLVLSQMTLFRPELMSFLCLALTFYILWRPARKPGPGRLGKFFGLTHGRWWVLLPFLFALWANLDVWFFLGPVVVGLVLLGEWLQDRMSTALIRKEGMGAKEQKSLLFVLLCGLAATLVNPHTYHVWQLPGDLWTPVLDYVRANVGTVRWDLSPFDFQTYLKLPAPDQRVWFRPRGLSVADWAYYPLALASLLSFLLGWKHLSWARALIWVAFFGLSVWQVRNVGLFAVAAGPILVLNLHDWLRGRFGDGPVVTRGWVAVGQVGRILLLFLSVGLAGLVLFARPHEPGLERPGREAPLGVIHARGPLGWSILADESLRQSAEKLAEWRQADMLPGRAFTVGWEEHPSYGAFFDTTGRWFMDRRFKLHEETAKEFYSVFRLLSQTREGPGEARDFDLEQIFRKHNISHVILNASSTVTQTDPTTRQPVKRSLAFLLIDDRTSDGKRKWQQLDYTDGRTLILAWNGWEGWKDPSRPYWSLLEKLKYAPDQEAFGTPRRATALRGRVDAKPLSTMEIWLSGDVRRRPLAVDELRWHWDQAEVGLQEIQDQVRKSGVLQTTRMPAQVLAGTPIPILPVMTESLTGSAPLLAVRAGRRAIVENPLHADSYYWLYRAYQSLQRQENYVFEVRNPAREVQMIAALRNSAVLHPNEIQRQMELTRWYFSRNVPDLGIAHYQRAVQILKANMAIPEGGVEERDRVIREVLDNELRIRMDQAETRYQQVRGTYVQQAAVERDPFRSAQAAISMGLLDHARAKLEQAVAMMPQQGPFRPTDNQAFLQLLQLYLQLGYANEALILFAREDSLRRLGSQAFFQFGALVEAADGNYEGALLYRDRLDELYRQSALNGVLEGLASQTLGGQSEPFGSWFHGMGGVIDGLGFQRQRADLLCQTGLLALEAGLTERAAEYFRRAVEDVHDNSSYRPFAGRYYRLITGKYLGSVSK